MCLFGLVFDCVVFFFSRKILWSIFCKLFRTWILPSKLSRQEKRRRSRSIKFPLFAAISAISAIEIIIDPFGFFRFQETDIGRHVNSLRKHPSTEVRKLVKQLVRWIECNLKLKLIWKVTWVSGVIETSDFSFLFSGSGKILLTNGWNWIHPAKLQLQRL